MRTWSTQRHSNARLLGAYRRLVELPTKHYITKIRTLFGTFFKYITLLQLPWGSRATLKLQLIVSGFILIYLCSMNQPAGSGNTTCRNPFHLTLFPPRKARLLLCWCELTFAISFTVSCRWNCQTNANDVSADTRVLLTFSCCCAIVDPILIIC